MPYRRLPNTDQARLTALQKAVQKASEADFTEQVIRYQTLSKAQTFLAQFLNVVTQYHQNFNSKVSANKQYRHQVQNARMYISHFIQVLNLAVIRGEIRKDQKELYKLDPESHILPDLSSEEDLLVWGQNIIDGENERVRQGGFPIYNPAINKVKVLELWNQIEEFYRNELPYARMRLCEEYGVRYYYRTGEKKLSAETDRKLKSMMDSQPTLQWSE